MKLGCYVVNVLGKACNGALLCCPQSVFVVLGFLCQNKYGNTKTEYERNCKGNETYLSSFQLCFFRFYHPLEYFSVHPIVFGENAKIYTAKGNKTLRVNML